MLHYRSGFAVAGWLPLDSPHASTFEDTFLNSPYAFDETHGVYQLTAGIRS